MILFYRAPQYLICTMIDTLYVFFVGVGSDGSTELCRRVGDALYACHCPAGTQQEGHLREGGLRSLLARYPIATQIHHNPSQGDCTPYIITWGEIGV